MTTKESIEKVYNTFEEWGMLAELTPKEREQVKVFLIQIAKDSIMESHQRIQHIIPNLYNSIQIN